MAINKRLGGFSNIHIATMNADGTYMAPTPLTGAKSVDVTLKYDDIQFYADNNMDFYDFIFNNGDGKLTVSGLTMTEYTALFGSVSDSKGGIVVKSSDESPQLALLFERQKLGTQDKILYALYACKFQAPSITAKTHEGKVDEETVDITFVVTALTDNSVYYMIDSATGDPTVVSGFYTTVHKPV